MLITPMDRLDATFFERISESVKVIATYSVGLDHIDLKAAAARNISIGYTPGVNADATQRLLCFLCLELHAGPTKARSWYELSLGAQPRDRFWVGNSAENLSAS